MKKQQGKDDVNINKENFVLKSDKTVASKYLKVQDLGKGTYSNIYRVQNKTSFKVCLCKELAKDKIADLTKFKNEVNILSKADHPNIVKLYEVFEDNKHVSLIMEECTGGELFERLLEKIDRDEAFSEKEAAGIFKQLMQAVCYMHSQGICHRDLKPENILFANKDPDSPIKVIDFSLSKIFGEIKPLVKGSKPEKNTMSARVGTAYYISPEVLQGSYDNKCDIWSCGVILYLLLCGYPPFDGDTEAEIYKAVLKKKYYFPEDDWKGISDDAKDLIKKMICDPDKRINAEMVLGHPWVEKLAPNSTGNLDKLKIENLRAFRNAYKFKKITMTFIASRLGESEVKDLKAVFEEMDTDKNGTLSIEEFKNGLIKLRDDKKLEITDEEIEKLYSSIDTNNSRRIEYTEFITASMEQKNYMREEYLTDVFKMLDVDGSGKLSKKEIKSILDNEGLENDVMKKLIEEFDLNGDGQIDFNEFITKMGTINKKEEEVPEPAPTKGTGGGKKGHK